MAEGSQTLYPEGIHWKSPSKAKEMQSRAPGASALCPRAAWLNGFFALSKTPTCRNPLSGQSRVVPNPPAAAPLLHHLQLLHAAQSDPMRFAWKTLQAPGSMEPQLNRITVGAARPRGAAGGGGQPPEVQHSMEIIATCKRFQALMSYLGACF